MSGDSFVQISDAEGVVKWFSHVKGYGFLVGPDDKDVLVHFSVIEGEGFKSLGEGDAVRYDAVRSEKGWKATRVVKLAVPDVNVTIKKGYSRTPRR